MSVKNCEKLESVKLPLESVKAQYTTKHIGAIMKSIAQTMCGEAHALPKNDFFNFITPPR